MVAETKQRAAGAVARLSRDGATVVTEMEQQSMLGTESESGDSGLLLTNERSINHEEGKAVKR
ncbi:hypothetical protein WN943_002879 [Citrus x changshan-huyou]